MSLRALPEAAPTRGQSKSKSILIHGYRRAHPEEEETCRVEEARALKLDPIFYQRPAGKYKTYRNNSWYVVTDTVTGPKVSEIFRGLPQDKPIFSRTGTGCLVVGSFLYDIGGRGCSRSGLTSDYTSNQIRRLDIKNPNVGWKSQELPFYCSDLTTAVSGRFIYLFPSKSWFTTPEMPWTWPWAYIYDTVEQKACELKLPDDCIPTHVSFCVSLEGCRILVPIIDEETRDRKFFIHHTNESKWEQLNCDCEVALFYEMCNGMPYCISNGVLYVYTMLRDGGCVLSAYDINNNWNSLGPIRLPKFDKLDLHHEISMFMVPTSDTELCFLWHNYPYIESDLYFAKVSVSRSTATLLDQAVLGINAIGIINCLPQ